MMASPCSMVANTGQSGLGIAHPKEPKQRRRTAQMRPTLLLEWLRPPAAMMAKFGLHQLSSF